MSNLLIGQYYSKVEKIIQYGGSRKESALRSAFRDLINAYCESKNLLLINELEMKTPFGTTIIPDGTVKDGLRMDWGYWESKDQYDNLEKEIEDKFSKGYPRSNILFEDSLKAVLFQGGARVMEARFDKADELDAILTCFVNYQPSEVRQFREAIEIFKEDLPGILTVLRHQIDSESENSEKFRSAKHKFLNLCKDVINPHITEQDIREMIIQHILTEEIFLTVFDEPQFHRENNIARELYRTVNTFFTGEVRRNTLDRVKTYYLVIKRAAANIANHHEKQKFLKALYENFYTAYNPKAADRLGIFYTPNEIVRFMIESTDFLLEKCFGKLLSDPGVNILDPAAGTGTFVTELIEYLPKAQLARKYTNEIHCNEVSILPYYIANLNIEFTYKQKMGEYAEFKNICFMDTLDHAVFSKKQYDIFSVTVENTERIARQNKGEIFVIIGNPPYNANQMNENENNKNREYPGIDERIKNTYIAASSAQKTKLYDMYARFFRWASDRIGDREGIVAFVTNSSFIEARTFDGFRKVAAEEFNEIYIADLGGNIRKKEKANVFGIKTGVAVSFMIKYCNRRDSLRKKQRRGQNESQRCRIYYCRVPEFGTAKEKLDFLSVSRFTDLDFEHIVPDENSNWINLSHNDFDDLLPLADKETKAAKSAKDENALFKLFSLGVSTNRDEWVYDFDRTALLKKMKLFCSEYNKEVSRHKKEKQPHNIDNFVNYEIIKWSSTLKERLRRKERIKPDAEKIRSAIYRPFVKKFLYYDSLLVDRPGLFKQIFHEGDSDNKVILFKTGSEWDFFTLVSDKIHDLLPQGGSKSLPLYRYEADGTKVDNITDWGLQQFTTHYKNRKISRENIFHYVYAVLHNPAYRKTYEQNLKRELPRIPFYENFQQWAAWGKELMNLHISFESIDPYPLERKDIADKSPKPKLKADKDSGIIVIDTATSLHGVPKSAWEYRLGTYCALQWILDQYKEKKIKDSTVAEKFGTYRFSDYKEKVIDLLMRVCTVSVRTVEIIGEMEKQF
ncbi:MAG: type ISP restriction/modification enzyme [Desulfococcaceae bacterium]